ncbi:MAG: tetratricopeptide repeat protein [Chitinivibrionales bacterium]|nr:tetratricopeptide repeat protein [Chitinivibrionales bacterium]
MKNSPLELYEKAYRLHYIDNKLPEACRIYESLIKEFPESNECGYAVIQLQKIQSNVVSETSARLKQGTHPLVVVTLMLNLLVAIALVVLAGYYLNSKEQQLEYVSSLSRAIVKAQIGRDNEALALLSDLKINTQGDLTPYLLTADIYRANQMYDRAVEELDTIREYFPEATILEDEIMRIQNEASSRYRVAEKASGIEGPPAPEDSPKPQVSRSKRPVSRRRSSSGRSGKKAPQLLVDEDSISFF